MSKYFRNDILDDDDKDLSLSASFLKELDYSMIFAVAVYLGCLVSSVWAPGRNLVLILILRLVAHRAEVELVFLRHRMSPVMHSRDRHSYQKRSFGFAIDVFS